MTINVKHLLRFYYYIDMEDGTETTNIDEDKLVELLQAIVDKLELKEDDLLLSEALFHTVYDAAK